MRACDPLWLERVSAWFDGELAGAEREDVLRHLRTCPGCAREVERFGQLRGALRGLGTPADRPLPATGPSPRVGASRWAWSAALAAAAVLITLVSVALARSGLPGDRVPSFALDLERAHLRAFSRTSPCEFESSDPREVQAWVRREVGYEVPVAIVPGSTLLGARRHKLQGRVSAALLYRNGDRALTLFFPPSGSPMASEVARFAGTEVRCTQGPVGETLCVAPLPGAERSAVAVSELDAGVLRDALARVGP